MSASDAGSGTNIGVLPSAPNTKSVGCVCTSVPSFTSQIALRSRIALSAPVPVVACTKAPRLLKSPAASL